MTMSTVNTLEVIIILNSAGTVIVTDLAKSIAHFR